MRRIVFPGADEIITRTMTRSRVRHCAGSPDGCKTARAFGKKDAEHEHAIRNGRKNPVPETPVPPARPNYPGLPPVIFTKIPKIPRQRLSPAMDPVGNTWQCPPGPGPTGDRPIPGLPSFFGGRYPDSANSGDLRPEDRFYRPVQLIPHRYRISSGPYRTYNIMFSSNECD